MMITTRRLGTLPSRTAIIRGAANEWILLQKLEPYPQGQWSLTQEALDLWVSSILTRANSEAQVFEYPPFTVIEATNELRGRGYVLEEQEGIIIRPEPPPAVLPPVDQPVPPVPKKSSFPWWLLVLIAAALLLRDDKGRRRRRARGTGPQGDRRNLALSPSPQIPSSLSGGLMNCAVWDEADSPRTRGLRWQCLMYAPATRKPGATCASPTFPKQKKVCITSKKVPTRSPFFKVKRVDRCAKYAPACTTGATLDEPMPKPHEPTPGHYYDPELERRLEREIRTLAESMAREKNELEEGPGKAFGREIMSRGGLRQHKYYKGAAGKEEFQWVPLFMRRKTGLPPDEMAAEMGITESELMRLIQEHYPGIKKIKRKYNWEDFERYARDAIYEEQGRFAGTPQQGELFPGLRRELVLTAEDPATSDDPLTVCLERAGWTLARINTLRDSIIEKRQPGVFTGKAVALNRSEKELEAATQRCLEKSKGLAGLGFMSTSRIAEGVRKGVKQNKERMKHGDTGLNAFYITPSLDIVPWSQKDKLQGDVGNVSVHSHSAENWNQFLKLSGQREPPFRFSDGDIKIFRRHQMSGVVDTDALIMADGRMITVHCPWTAGLHLVKDDKIDRWKYLPKGWNTMKKYEGLTSLAAAQKRQGEFYTRIGCTWTMGRWRDEDETDPPLVQPLTSERTRAAEKWARLPVKIYERDPVTGEEDLTKASVLMIPGWMYPTDPAQPELFKHLQRKKRATTGERKITLGPDRPPVQTRFFGLRRTKR